MLIRVILAVTVGLVSVATPAPAMAAAPPPAPDQTAPFRTIPLQTAPTKAEPEQDCEQILQQAQRIALASGKAATVPCVTFAPPAAAAVAPDAPAVQEFCGVNEWAFSRHTACLSGLSGVLSVYGLVEGREVLVGQILFTITTGTSTSGNSARWTHSLSMTPTFMWGAVGNTYFIATAECAANCNFESSNFNSAGPILAGVTRSGSATLSTTSYGEGTVWRAWSTWAYWFRNPDWIIPVSNTLRVSAPDHRCDEAIGIRFSIGCVYSQVRPLHEIGRTRYRKYARHIELAINFGLPSILTRTQVSAQVAANRARACPQSPANGWSCDEYPFASTHEGAANPIHPYGRTFQILNWNNGAEPFVCGVGWLSPRRTGDSLGYSICGIPLEENTGGGTDLGNFYIRNRVLHDDRFQVMVV